MHVLNIRFNLFKVVFLKKKSKKSAGGIGDLSESEYDWIGANAWATLRGSLESRGGH